MAERMKLTFQERLNTVLGESYLKKYSPQEALNKYLEETNLHKYSPQEALKIIADDTTEYTPQEILNALYDQTDLHKYSSQEAMNLMEEFNISLLSDQAILDQHSWTFKLPIGNSLYIDWGDGNSSEAEGKGNIDEVVKSRYTSPGTYNIKITGDFDTVTKIKIDGELHLTGNFKLSLFTSLIYIFLRSTNITVVSQGMKNLSALDYIYLNSLSNVEIGENVISGWVAVAYLYISALGLVSISTTETFRDMNITINDCNMTEGSIDNTVARLVALEWGKSTYPPAVPPNYTASLAGVTNSEPSAAGKTNIDTLRAWGNSVTVTGYPVI